MCDYIKIDNELIDKERGKHKLPKPVEFEGGMLSQELVEKLMVLLALPFDDRVIDKGRNSGFETIGINYNLQLNRLQNVFGVTHVKIEHEVKDKKAVENDNRRTVTHYCKVYVTIKIGNYVAYNNADNKPDTNFVPFYISEGIGWAGAANEGTAEKSARANGIKEALKGMGMLRYLYIDAENEDDAGDSGYGSGEMRGVELLADAVINNRGPIFMKCDAKDLDNEKAVELIVYRENSYNKEQHAKMVSMLEQHRDLLKKGKKLNVLCFEKLYKGNLQYIVNGIKKANGEV